MLTVRRVPAQPQTWLDGANAIPGEAGTRPIIGR